MGGVLGALEVFVLGQTNRGTSETKFLDSESLEMQ